MSARPSPMMPGESSSANLVWLCPNGHETYERSRGRCLECGAVLEESRAPSFKQKVRSSVPEPSQRLMDEMLDDGE